RRIEDERFITGRGQFTADLAPEDSLHAFVLRSPHAHAEFHIRDLAAARAAPGVRLVLTAEDVAHLGPLPCLAPIDNGDGSRTYRPERLALAKGRTRFVGDAVAFIVADSVAQARDGAEAIAIDWEPRPAAPDIRAATEEGAPLVWPEAPGNI